MDDDRIVGEEYPRANGGLWATSVEFRVIEPHIDALVAEVLDATDFQTTPRRIPMIHGSVGCPLASIILGDVVDRQHGAPQTPKHPMGGHDGFGVIAGCASIPQAIHDDEVD